MPLLVTRVRFPVRSFYVIPLGQCQQSTEAGTTDSIVQILFKNSFHVVYFSKQYFIKVSLPFCIPSFLYLRCLCSFFLRFFFLLEVAVCNSKNQNRINLDSYLPIYTFAPCFFFFSTAFRRRLCFVRENSLACAWKWIYDAIDILFDNTVVIMRCYFSVPFGLILSHLTNPTQNVPSCIIECVTNKFSSSYCWHFMAV